MFLQLQRHRFCWSLLLILCLCGELHTSDSQPKLELRLIGDTNATIAPGESIPIIVSVTVKGSGELAIRTKEQPSFVSTLRKKFTCQSECEITERIVISPTAADCGNHSFRVTASFTSNGDVIRTEQRTSVTVVPGILAEPPFTRDNANEIIWTPCLAHNHELFFSPGNGAALTKNAPLFKQAAVELDRQVVENLSSGTRYRYWVEATLTDGGVSTLVSDDVFSTQDNTPPPRVEIRNFAVDDQGNVTLTWTLQADEISFVQEYRISRRQLEPAQDDPDSIATIPFFPVFGISPKNYFPVTAENGRKMYLDLDETILKLPSELHGAVLIKTAGDDRWNVEEEFLTLNLHADSYVYIAIDKDVNPRPDWLRDRFTKDFAGRELDVQTTLGRFRLYRSKERLSPGPHNLGGNFAAGSGFHHRDPNMYFVFVKPVDERFPFAAGGEFSFTDSSVKDDLSILQYEIKAVDAVGNMSDGLPSPPIVIDLNGKCQPKLTSWFVFPEFPNDRDEYFGKDLTNTVCIADPNADPDCMGFRDSDSLRFQAVRDSMKFFGFHLPEDEDVQFFDSGWLPVDSLCYTFDFAAGGKDADFINGHRFFYRVQAKDVHGNLSAWSDTVSAIQDAFAPGDISNLACEAEIFPECTDGVLKVTWDAALDDASGVESYQIHRRIEGEDFQLVGQVDDSVTMFADTLSNIGSPKVVHYKVGSTDNLGHVRTIDDSDLEIWKRAPIGPMLVPDSTDVVNCPGFLGTSLDTVRVILRGDNTDVLKYRIIVKGPVSVKELILRDTAVDTVEIPLNEGDGVYWITARAEYSSITSTCSDSLHIIKRNRSAQPVENLMAMQDSEPTGNIILKWTYPDTSQVAEFRVFVWPEGQPMPAKPDTVITTPRSKNKLDILGLTTYECDSMKVQVVDCFGNFSENDPTVTQYSNRPPKIRCEESEALADRIVIRWDRPESLYAKAVDFESFVQVYQGTISEATLFKSEPVLNNKQSYTLFNPPRMRDYIFRVKEVNISDLMQSCADTFMTNFSKPCAVPFDNFPNSVSPLVVQPLPVPVQADSGCAFFSWEGYQRKVRVDSFVVRYWTIDMAMMDSIRVSGSQDTALVCDLGMSKDFAATVIAIDRFGQRSAENDTVMFNFKPRWAFTPDDITFADACFRDSVTVTWNWVGMDLSPRSDTTFGADMVQLEISIDSTFTRDKTMTPWFDLKREHTFQRSADYPFASAQNDTVYARIRAKDKFGHISPWSTDYFRPTPFSRFDEVPPTIVRECRVDSVRAPDRGLENSVSVHLSWDSVLDNCSGTVSYIVVINETDTVEVDTTFFVDREVPADSLVLTRWKILPVDRLGNLQEIANACGVTVSLEPPNESSFAGDRTICWNEGQANVPSDTTLYIIEISNNPRFLRGNDLLSETSPPLDTLCYEFQRPWNPDSLFWRVKCLSDDFESPWSGIFDSDSTGSELLVSSISPDETSVPRQFRLFQNYPNPFNPSTTIGYDVARTIEQIVHIRIEIFNVLGQKIRTLIDEDKPPGHYSVVWDGRDDLDVLSGSGVYYFQMRGHDSIITRKMLFLK